MKNAFGKAFNAFLIVAGTIFVAGVAEHFVGWYLAVLAGIVGVYFAVKYVIKNRDYFGF